MTKIAYVKQVRLCTQKNLEFSLFTLLPFVLQFRAIPCLVQSDIFFQHLTVRDQLTYTALLRMPGAMRTEVKHEEVNKVIRILRLTKVADSPIKLLSGGEKKRVNIGTELLTDPGVLLLDEPTR